MLAFRSVVSVLVPRGLTGNQQPSGDGRKPWKNNRSARWR